MTRARWIVGGLLGAGALVIAFESLAAYAAAHSAVGVVATLVLIGILGVGLVSLARARRDIGRELTALGATPPGGALYKARREQAVELQRRGVTPDLDALADATAAEEAERAFTGKYLVATTILVGLVGTFGGLMETLSRLSPLLKGEVLTEGAAGVFTLIAGPLAGLHVTFGTSIVAILVTLSLALVQGDVTVHHERLLARLQERTRHVLLPELAPAQVDAAEQTVRELKELRALVAQTLATTADSTATKVAEAVRAEARRLTEELGAAVTTTAAAARSSIDAATTAVRDQSQRLAADLGASVSASAEATRDAM
ncbi:MAG TPA: hypothetical protein VHK47_03790, partial [Polyangia bacterium]|nr:hypothetical protein [Polyangia bacterium]